MLITDSLEGRQGPALKSETHSRSFQDRTFFIENLTPEYLPEQREKVRREIEQTLYEVFSKYA